MTTNLKKLEDQTIVITGASFGIGLTTARKAAERGARLVLVARSEDALRERPGGSEARGHLRLRGRGVFFRENHDLDALTSTEREPGQDDVFRVLDGDALFVCDQRISPAARSGCGG